MKKEDIGHPSHLYFEETQSFIDNEIVFLRRLDESRECKKIDPDEDKYKCFLWERGRTFFYENPDQLPLIPNDRKGLPFPLSEADFPRTSYLSHRVEARAKWEVKMPKTQSKHENLFHNSLFLEKKLQGCFHDFMRNDSEVSFFGNNASSLGGIQLSPAFFPQESQSVPLVFNIGINWNKTNLKDAILKQWSEIEEKRNKLKKIYEERGARFSSKSSVRIDEVLSPILKQLGHYRLLCHCKKHWGEVRNYMIDFTYSLEDKLYEAIRKGRNEEFFPLLKLSSGGGGTSSSYKVLYGN